MATGTPAITALRAAGAAFSVHEYEHDPRAASYGLEAAAALGVDAERVFKTLLADVDGELCVGIVPVTESLDLKALAAPFGTPVELGEVAVEVDHDDDGAGVLHEHAREGQVALSGFAIAGDDDAAVRKLPASHL